MREGTLRNRKLVVCGQGYGSIVRSRLALQSRLRPGFTPDRIAVPSGDPDRLLAGFPSGRAARLFVCELVFDTTRLLCYDPGL